MYPLTITGIITDDKPTGTRLSDICQRHGLTSQAEILRNVCVARTEASPLGDIVPAATVPDPAVPRDIGNTQLMPTISA